MRGLGWVMLAASVGGFLLSSGFDAWRLVQGYDIGFSLNRGPVSVEHVDFPIWRLLLQPILIAVVLGIAGLCVANRRVRGLGTASFVGVAALAAWDFYQYGLATPTPLVTIALAGVVALLSAKLRRPPKPHPSG